MLETIRKLSRECYRITESTRSLLVLTFHRVLLSVVSAIRWLGQIISVTIRFVSSLSVRAIKLLHSFLSALIEMIFALSLVISLVTVGPLYWLNALSVKELFQGVAGELGSIVLGCVLVFVSLISAVAIGGHLLEKTRKLPDDIGGLANPGVRTLTQFLSEIIAGIIIASFLLFLTFLKLPLVFGVETDEFYNEFLEPNWVKDWFDIGTNQPINQDFPRSIIPEPPVKVAPIPLELGPDHDPVSAEKVGNEPLPFSKRLTSQESLKLVRTVARCWNRSSIQGETGSKSVRVVINYDVEQRPVLVEPHRFQHTSTSVSANVFQAARRAIYRCSGSSMGLPAHRYEGWETTVLTFAPEGLIFETYSNFIAPSPQARDAGLSQN